MSIELQDYLRMNNTEGAKAAAKRKAEEKERKKEAKKPLVIAEITKYGNYSEEEAELIFQINENVMSVDGTAEGWAYDCNPLDYLDISVSIFDLTKKFFSI